MGKDSDVGVLARDRDSFTFRTQLVDVAVDFGVTLRYAKYRLNEVLTGSVNDSSRSSREYRGSDRKGSGVRSTTDST